MKKTLALILVAVMLLSTLVALVVPAAAEGEGDWAVYLTATSVDSATPEKNPPLPGYYYDETGFHTKSPDYTNYNPKFTVVSKEMYNIQNFSMTVVVHDYACYQDNWLSFSIWSESNGIDQGGVSGKYGDGWTSLIRNWGTEKLEKLESWNATIGGRQNKQQFTAIDNTQTTPVAFEEVLNEDGDRVLTFSIEEGIVKINGVTIGAGTDKVIADRFNEGLAYVAVTLHNTDSSGNYKPTISITDVNGEMPTGSDSREPESKKREYGPEIDPATVLPGTPAIWFDASGEATNPTIPQHTGANISYADDNKSFLVEFYQESFQMHFAVPDEITHMAPNYTYFAIMYKNFCVCNLEEGQTPFEHCTRDGGSHQNAIWYFSGDTTSATGEGVYQPTEYYCINPVDENGASTVDDYYTMAVFQINNPDFWQGRIHGVRLDVGGLTNYDVEGHTSMEILGAGFFKSGNDVIEYVSNFDNMGFNTDDLVMTLWDCTVSGCIDTDADGYCDICWEVVGDVCEHVDSDSDNLCDNCGEDMSVPGGDETDDSTTEAPTEATTEEATDKLAESTTAADKPSSDDEGEEDKKGCGSVVSMGALAIVSVLGMGLVIKKKEN